MPIYPYSFQLPPLNVQDIPNDGAVGEFLGISAGGVLDWLPVSASGGGDMLKSENLSGLADYPTARTNLGLGTGDSPTFKNLTISTGTIATSAPVTISQTWGAVAQTFKALVVNAAGSSDANSASGSLLADFQVNGVSKVTVRKDGAIVLPYGYAGIVDGSVNAGGTNYTWNGPRLGPFALIAWTATSPAGTPDTILLRDGAANTLALRNGDTVQTFNLYGTYTSAGANYARLGLTCAANGTVVVSSQAAGSGVAGAVQLAPNNVVRLSVGTNGIVNATHFQATQTLQVGAGYIKYPNAGIFSFTNSAENDFVRFNLGPATALFPAIKRNGAGIQIRLGNDTDNTTLEAGNIYSTGNVGIGTTAPAEKLDVAHNSAAVLGQAAYGLKIRNVNGSDFAATGILFNVRGDLDATLPGKGAIVYDGRAVGSFGRGDMHFLQSSAASGAAPVLSDAVMTLRNNGNVGIGTTAPSSKLHVVGDITLPNGGSIFFGGGFNIYGTTTGTTINGPTSFGTVQISSNGVTKWVFNYDGLLCGGGTTASFPALKRSTTTLQARLADDTAFAPIQGKLTTDTAYTGTVVAATGYITIYDSTGTAYRVPCAV